MWLCEGKYLVPLRAIPSITPLIGSPIQNCRAVPASSHCERNGVAAVAIAIECSNL